MNIWFDLRPSAATLEKFVFATLLLLISVGLFDIPLIAAK
jgi:hypothetical protein